MLGTDLIKGAKGVEEYSNGVIDARECYRLVESGELPVIRKGRKMFFRKSELEAAFKSDAGKAA